MKKRLLFVSPRFLFPVDSGGKIRTTQILRGLKGGAFEITLVSPASRHDLRAFSGELDSVADRYVHWPQRRPVLLATLLRYASLFDALPVPIAIDRSWAGSRVLHTQLMMDPDIVIFDFPHSAVLAKKMPSVTTLLFTHNVEAEIFKRHAAVNSGIKNLIWRSQYRKMVQYERTTLKKFETVIAVSARDAEHFCNEYGVTNVEVISTGVDSDYFRYHVPADEPEIVFIGSMDWLANIDAIDYFMEDVWPLLERSLPDTSMTVVGRNPPAWLVRKAENRRLRWRFTGFVDDVRESVRKAALCVIPLRIGGGTRLKVYEAMAMGCPIVSTPIGVEGLPVVAGEHYLCAETADEFAGQVSRLLLDRQLRAVFSRAARRFVEAHCSQLTVVKQFERICNAAIENSPHCNNTKTTLSGRLA